MKLLYVVDGRSPIAMNWVGYFAEAGHEIHLVSTFTCSPKISLASLTILPVALSGIRKSLSEEGNNSSPSFNLRNLAPVTLRTSVRRWLGPLTLNMASRKLTQLVELIKPDMVHAMRIPFEGMLAALALESRPRIPLLVSVWGNDFTLHAPATPLMRFYTRRTLQRADALHADCRRDARLANEWGFATTKSAFVLPGGGGIQLELFHPPTTEPSSHDIQDIFKVINPRGYRAYVRNDTFFRSIPMIRRAHPQIHFVCPAMSGESQARSWMNKLGLSEGIELLPWQSRATMADLYRQARVVVSPSEHDGTPNTLLEAMASGCFPIAGDIESVREWIKPGENGLLFDPGSPDRLASAVIESFRNPDLLISAREHNLQMVAERAEHQKVMKQAEVYYQSLTSAGRAGF